MNKIQKTGLLLAFSAPLLYSLFNAGFKILSRDLSPLGFLWIRGLVGMVLAGSLALATRSRPARRHLGILGLAGLSSALSTACVTTAITAIPLYQAIVILYLYPALSVILGFLVNGERIGSLEALGLAVAFAGCALLVWPDRAAAGPGLGWAHLAAFLGSLLFALPCVLIRRLGDDNDGLWPFFSYSLFSVLSAWPLAASFGVGLAPASVSLLALGAGLAVFGSLGQLTTYAALRYLPAFKVGVIGSLEVLGGALASRLIFDEPLTARALAGGALILYAAFGFRRGEKA
ncbi:MAG: DMT family transporter [Deltaproteobacteria bacterium]|nr:DMT family transporter [Deltaproteobacteria bacterium]